MTYDLTDSRFEFSELIDSESVKPEDLEDLELLELFNFYPRLVGKTVDSLKQIEAEVARRELLVPPSPLSIEDRTDDWLAERRNEIRLAISVNAREEEALKAERELIDKEFIRRFTERKASGTRAGRFTISMKIDDNYPEVTDRTSFEEYVLSTGKLHLLQKRLALSSVKEELAAFEQERVACIKALNEENFKREACFAALMGLENPSISDDQRADIINTKLDILTATGRLEEAVVGEINDYYTIPGVNVVPKLTINQVHRN